MSQKKKRYYVEGEKVYVRTEKAFGFIKTLEVDPVNSVYKATVVMEADGKELDLNLWEIDKDKRKTATRPVVGLDLVWNEVLKFQKAFGHPFERKPKMIEVGRAFARSEWMEEEIREFVEAKTVKDQADAMIDLIYFAIGTLVEMGVKPQAIFDIVQNANMSKLFPDGKPRYREDGKVKKPDGWEAPEPLIELEIQRQLNA